MRDNERRDEVKRRFAEDPMPLIKALSLRVDEHRSKPPSKVWCFDGNETKASLLVGGRNGTEGHWTRFGTEDAGDCFQLVQRCRPSMDFKDALRFVADVYGVEMPERVAGERSVYPVRDADGNLVAEHHRLDLPDGSKRLWWQRNGRKGLLGLKATDLPLYGLPDLLQQPQGRVVVVTEGEKDCDAVRSAGLTAVATYGADVLPCDESLRPLLDYLPVLWPDNDAPGERHMDAVAGRLITLGAKPARVVWNEAPSGGGAADATPEQIRELASAAVDWRPAPPGTLTDDKCEAPPPLLVATGEVLDASIAATTWLWPGWIPRGHITFLAGRPGAGKSCVTLALAMRLWFGEAWPDGAENETRGAQTLMADTEAGEALTRDRARAWGLPLDALLFPWAEAMAVQRISLDPSKPRPGEKFTDIERMRRLLEVKEVPLVIIDTLRGGLPGGRDENDSAIQTFLAPWAELARDTGISILIVHHARKGERTGDDRAYTLDFSDLRGSSALGAVGRSIMLIDRPNSASGMCRPRVDKSNFGTLPAPVGFRITDGGVVFGEAPQLPRRDGEIERAQEWLHALLLKGPLPRPEVIAAGEDMGFAARTLDRAVNRDDRLKSGPDPVNPKRRRWCVRENQHPDQQVAG